MTRSRILLASVISLSAACGGKQSGGADEGGGPRAPDFQGQTIDGRPFRLGDHLGKDVVLISFWATWCRPCMIELPHFATLYRELNSKGFQVVAVAEDGPESESMLRPTIQRLDLPFTIVLDRETRIASLYNPRKICPTTVLIDRAGRVAWRHEGFVEGDQNEVERRVRELVAD